MVAAITPKCRPAYLPALLPTGRQEYPNTKKDSLIDCIPSFNMPNPQTDKARRRQRAKEITERSAVYAAGAGLIPVPIVDIAALSRVQVVLIRDICRIYEVDFKEHRLRTRIVALLGDVAAIGALKTIPVLGALFAGVTTAAAGAASTYALGMVFIEHFEQGGALPDFDPARFREAFQRELEKGKEMMAGLSKPTGREARVPRQDTVQYQELLEQNKALLASVRALREKLAALRKEEEGQ